MKKRKKLGAERLSEFFRQFSVLVESGLSIPETLEIMQQDDTDREFCLACRKLGAFMTEGKTVGDAMFYPQLGVKLCSMAGGGVQKSIWCF